MNEGLGMLLITSLFEELCILVRERDMPGHVGPAQVENALGPVAVDCGGVVVEV